MRKIFFYTALSAIALTSLSVQASDPFWLDSYSCPDSQVGAYADSDIFAGFSAVENDLSTGSYPKAGAGPLPYFDVDDSVSNLFPGLNSAQTPSVITAQAGDAYGLNLPEQELQPTLDLLAPSTETKSSGEKRSRPPSEEIDSPSPEKRGGGSKHNGGRSDENKVSQLRQRLQGTPVIKANEKLKGISKLAKEFHLSNRTVVAEMHRMGLVESTDNWARNEAIQDVVRRCLRGDISAIARNEEIKLLIGGTNSLAVNVHRRICELYPQLASEQFRYKNRMVEATDGKVEKTPVKVKTTDVLGSDSCPNSHRAPASNDHDLFADQSGFETDPLTLLGLSPFSDLGLGGTTTSKPYPAPDFELPPYRINAQAPDAQALDFTDKLEETTKPSKAKIPSGKKGSRLLTDEQKTVLQRACDLKKQAMDRGEPSQDFAEIAEEAGVSTGAVSNFWYRKGYDHQTNEQASRSDCIAVVKQFRKGDFDRPRMVSKLAKLSGLSTIFAEGRLLIRIYELHPRLAPNYGKGKKGKKGHN
jgi:hypothetical protein